MMIIAPHFLMLVILAAFALVLISLGNRATGADMKKTCRTCGAAHPSFARFCRRCGRKL